MFQQIEGRLDLTNTSMSIYRDTQQAWPPDARLIGARYNKLEGDEDALDRDRADIRTRLSWLKLDGRYHPQKYLALATAYQNVGQEAFGRRVLMSSEAERRVAGKHGLVWLLATVWSWMLRSIVGYGFSPARAVWWLLGLIGFGSLLTTLAKQAGLISALPKPMSTSIRCAIQFHCYSRWRIFPTPKPSPLTDRPTGSPSSFPLQAGSSRQSWSPR